jgi:adenylyltransferase/sulfurtransferase
MLRASSALDAATTARYTRQLLTPSFGVSAQIELRQLRVLVIGAGGLGCPAALYLAGAGVGTLGLADGDVVELSNLHRQVAHAEAAVGCNKAASLAEAAGRLNSGVRVVAHEVHVSTANAAALVAGYDVVLDCTDRPSTRYLINDACVLGGKPLVSGAALGTDGQVSVLGLDGGPCYRCLHPVAPPPELVSDCADAGVLGPVTGIVGCLLALEVMKLAAALARGQGESAHVPWLAPPLSGTLLVLDGSEGRMRSVRLRGRREECEVCGSAPSIHSLLQSAAWWARGSASCDCAEDAPAGGIVPAVHAPPSINPSALLSSPPPFLLLDVRERVQHAIARLQPSANLPWSELQAVIARSGGGDGKTRAVRAAVAAAAGLPDGDGVPPVFVLCRRGITSIPATVALIDAGFDATDVAGGIEALGALLPALNPY